MNTLRLFNPTSKDYSIPFEPEATILLEWLAKIILQQVAETERRNNPGQKLSLMEINLILLKT